MIGRGKYKKTVSTLPGSVENSGAVSSNENNFGGFQSFNDQSDGFSDYDQKNSNITSQMDRGWSDLSGNRGERSNNCFKCNQSGHMSRDCPEAGGGRGERSNNCFKCNQPGHMSRDCPEAGAGPAEGESAPPRATYCPTDHDKENTEKNMNTGLHYEAYDAVSVKVIGENAPKRLKDFSEANFPPDIQNFVERSFKKPFPVQTASIPVIMSGRDLICLAQTGSGKTAAFILPIAASLVKSGNYKSNDPPQDTSQGVFRASSPQPRALIMTPTRELAKQIFQHADVMAGKCGLSVKATYGGIQMNYSRMTLLQGCDILIATPGRLNDFLSKGFLNLQKCDFFVLDEADTMLSSDGFYDAVNKVVENFGERKPQVLMFSATFPLEVNDLANKYLDPQAIRIEVGVLGTANSDVTQRVFNVSSRDKERKLEEVLANFQDKKVLVFAERKAQADFLGLMYASNLQDVTHVLTLHSDRTQEQRENTMAEFKNRRKAMLFATSVAARGLDIPFVDCVINYDMPKKTDDYIHRIGRTARAGRQGESISFFDPRSDVNIAESLLKILSSSNQEVPDWLLELTGGGNSFGNDYSESPGFEYSGF